MADSALHTAPHTAAPTLGVRRPCICQTPAPHVLPPHTSARVPAREATIFGDAGPDEIAELLGHAVELDVIRGETVYVAGDTASDLYLVRTGKVKLVTDTRHRGERITAVLLRGDHFGHDGISTMQRYRTAAIVVSDARLLRVPAVAVRRWMHADPDRSLNLARLLNAEVQQLHTTLTDLAELDTAARLAKQLLQFARRLNVPSHGPALVQHDLTQAELAQLVGSSRETVCKVLSDFSRRGWLRVDSRSVTILDHGRLMSRSTPN